MTRRLASALAAALLLPAGAAAQGPGFEGTPPAAVDAESLRIAVDAGRMTVPVTVDGRGPYPFVIDTGAERSVVSRELADTLQLRGGGRARVYDFAGSSVVETVRVPSLAISTLGARAVDAPSLTLANLGAPGMLGIDALQGHKLSIDFGRKRMTVAPARRHADGQVVVKAEKRLGQLIVTQARFEGHPIAVVVDTGSWVSVGNSAMLALARHPPRRVAPISVKSVTGGTFDADYVTVNNLSVGGVQFDNVGLTFADVTPFERFGLRYQPALILGMSSLSLFHRVEIDFANREIAFTLPREPINFSHICRSYLNCASY